MVLAYHVIFGTYGFWLPNDPRGSWSKFVRSWELFLAGGEATTTSSRRSVARRHHDVESRRRAKKALKYPPVILTGPQAASVGAGFAEMVEKSQYQVYACSILPEHVHLVLGRHHYEAETMVRLLKAQASRRLSVDGRHPMEPWPTADGTLPTPWAEKCWKVFLNTEEDVYRSIRYVENNPIKEGKRRQSWSFVISYAELPPPVRT